MTYYFHCDQCGQDKTHVSNITTGYGTNKEGQIHCFDCCGLNDRRDLENLPMGGRTFMYLQKNAAGDWCVSNWPGTFKLLVSGNPRKGRHNIAGSRYDVWFRFVSNQTGEMLFFHGVQYGEWTQVCHVRRVRSWYDKTGNYRR